MGPHDKDYNILGSILGSPYSGKLPYRDEMWVIQGIHRRSMGLYRAYVEILLGFTKPFAGLRVHHALGSFRVNGRKWRKVSLQQSPLSARKQPFTVSS